MTKSSVKVFAIGLGGGLLGIALGLLLWGMWIDHQDIRGLVAMVNAQQAAVNAQQAAQSRQAQPVKP